MEKDQDMRMCLGPGAAEGGNSVPWVPGSSPYWPREGTSMHRGLECDIPDLIQVNPIDQNP